MPDQTPPAILPLPYDPSYEHSQDDEGQAIAGLEKIFVDMARTVAEKQGHAHRAVHAKGQGLLRGRLAVAAGLPPAYAQGLFAAAGSYEVLVRLSSPPAEQLPDTVSTPRALAMKIMDVPGERVPEAQEQHSQDFLMVNGPAFSRPGPQGFLKDSKLLAKTTEKMPVTKEVISTLLRGAEAVIEAVGGSSAKIIGMGGQPMTHPLGETYFTQVPFLYGPYIGKFSLAPVSPNLKALSDQKLETRGEDAQRDAVNAFFTGAQAAPAEWELRVQLCTDIEKMPIEDASVEWDQQLSPYVTVARLVIGPQPAWEDGRSDRLEDEIAFSPWHALRAHRPLGALNRARKVVMAASRDFRSGFNGCPLHEPRSGDLPRS